MSNNQHIPPSTSVSSPSQSTSNKPSNSLAQTQAKQVQEIASLNKALAALKPLESPQDLRAIQSSQLTLTLSQPNPEQLAQLKAGELKQLILSSHTLALPNNQLVLNIPTSIQAQLVKLLQQSQQLLSNTPLQIAVQISPNAQVKLLTLSSASALLPQSPSLQTSASQATPEQLLKQNLNSLNRLSLQNSALSQLAQLPELITKISLASADASSPSASSKTAQQTPLNDQLKSQLQQLLKQLPSSSTASQPQQLKQILLQSGLFFEQQNTQSKIANTLNLLNNDAGLNPKGQIPALPQDLKAALLALSKLNAQAATQQNAPTSTAQANTKDQINTKAHANTHKLESEFQQLKPNQFNPDLAQALAGFIKQQLIAKSDKPQAIEKNSLDLFRLLTGALARVQINQITSHPASAQLEPGTLNQWQFELLLNNQGQLDTMSLLLKEHYWHKDEQQNAQDGTQKQRRWSAIVNFEIPPLGNLAVELQLQGEQLNTKIWAPNPALYKLLDTEIAWLQDALRSAGIELESLETFNQAGPKAQAKLQQQLVDVQI